MNEKNPIDPTPEPKKPRRHLDHLPIGERLEELTKRVRRINAEMDRPALLEIVKRRTESAVFNDEERARFDCAKTKLIQAERLLTLTAWAAGDVDLEL